MDLNQYRDKNLDKLTKRQKEIFVMALSGKTQNEIANILNCSKQNISQSINYSCKSLDDNEHPSQRKKPTQPTKSAKVISDSYEKYKDCRYDILTYREREVLLLKLQRLTYSEISKKLGISKSAIGVLLQRAREKLNGERTQAQKWWERNKEIENAKRRNDPEYARRQKEYYEKNKAKLNEEKKEYNKQYYRKNQQEILARRKQRRKKATLGIS